MIPYPPEPDLNLGFLLVVGGILLVCGLVLWNVVKSYHWRKIGVGEWRRLKLMDED